MGNETNQLFASMWRKAREDAGYSQDRVAKALNVSKTTIQNWESGASCPSQSKGFEFFQVLGIHPLPYYLELLYPAEYSGINASISDQEVDNALCTLLKDVPSDVKRKLLYIAYGNHGSSPICIVELITAHLQTPLRARLNVAELVRTNYEMAESSGTLKHKEHIQPNIDLLNKAYIRCKDAVKKGLENYTSLL